MVSLYDDPDAETGLLHAPISEAIVTEWIDRVQSMTFDSRRPSPALLTGVLARYWLPDEAVLYIGKATSLRQRLGQYYSTPLGDRRPHAGGHWIKTLTNLRELTVHYAELNSVTDAQAVETRMLLAFSRAVSEPTRAGHPQPDLTIPFANLEMRPIRRNHGVRYSVLRG